MGRGRRSYRALRDGIAAAQERLDVSLDAPVVE